MIFTATDLKQRTRKILQLAKTETITISRYKEPEFILMSYSNWEKMNNTQKRLSFDLSNYMCKIKSIADSVEYISNLRDE